MSCFAGWFDERRPQFAAACRKTVASMDVECDLCSSKKCVFDVLGGLSYRWYSPSGSGSTAISGLGAGREYQDVREIRGSQEDALNAILVSQIASTELLWSLKAYETVLDQNVKSITMMMPQD